MTTTHDRHRDGAVTDHATGQADGLTSGATRALAVLRIAFGLTFLWAFFDKPAGARVPHRLRPERPLDRFGDAAGSTAQPDRGVPHVRGQGSLREAFYHSIAGRLGDWLFMLGLLGIGAALTSGSACGSPVRRAPCCTS